MSRSASRSVWGPPMSTSFGSWNGCTHRTRRGSGTQTDGRPSRHRDPVGSRISAEIVVERPVLLHHDDHVLDLVDALRDRRMPGQAHAESKRGERERHGENDREGSAGRSHHRSIRRPRGRGSPPDQNIGRATMRGVIPRRCSRPAPATTAVPLPAACRSGRSTGTAG